jgi:AcrR family transcriptional regulator
MSAEDRREMIVRAVLPLLIEHGTAITTNQIARAAGIGEGTIFRAFKDKDELFDACTAEALRPDHVLDVIAEIPVDAPLADRLVEAADALGAHLERMGALMGVLHASGRARRRDPDKRPKGGRRESTAAIRDAMIAVFEPDRDRLRLPADQLAALFVAVLFGCRRVPGGDVPAMRQVVEVFLHGAVADA